MKLKHYSALAISFLFGLSSFAALQFDTTYDESYVTGLFNKADSNKDNQLTPADNQWNTYSHFDTDGDNVLVLNDFLANTAALLPQLNAQITRNIIYKNASGENLLMDIYLPNASNYTNPPVLLYTHGGGWAAGDKEVSSHIATVFENLLSNGVACASISYRHVKMWRNTDSIIMRDCVIDARDALRFMKKEEAALGINSDIITVIGESAGAHLAMMSLWSSPTDFTGDTGLAPYQVQPVGGVSWFGPTDFRQKTLFEPDAPLTPYPGLPSIWANRITKYNGEIYDDMDLGLLDQATLDAMAEMSPVTYLTSSSKPLLHFHGTSDNVIPVKHAPHLETSATAVGAPVTIQTVTGATHGWNMGNSVPSPDQVLQQTTDYLMQVINAAVAGNASPTASISSDKSSGTAPLTIQFNSTGSTDFDGQIQSYLWEFGDGQTSTQANPTHTYTNAGIFTAWLTVTDDDGATGTDSAQIIVSPSGGAPTGLVLHYTFDQTTGTNVTDSSINGFNGVANKDTNWTADGKYGGAFNAGGNGFITVPTSFFTNLTEISVCAWIKNSTDKRGFFSGGFDIEGKYSSTRVLSGRAGVGGYEFVAGSTGAGYSARTLSGTEEPDSNDWSHWILTVKAGVSMSVYRDGNLLSTQSIPADRVINNILHFIIGRDPYSGFLGKIDDFRIYNKVLTTGEILAVIANLPPQAGGFDAWKTTKGLPSGSDAWDDDADGDGYINFIEYAFGGEPLTKDLPNMPVLRKNGADFEYDFSHLRSGLTPAVYLSDDLQVWTLSTDPLYSSSVSISNGVATINEAAIGKDTQFIRLQVSE